MSRVGGDGGPVIYTTIYTNRTFSMSEKDKKIDDELYRKIEWFCDKVVTVTPPQNDYEECMKVLRRMKNVSVT